MPRSGPYLESGPFMKLYPVSVIVSLNYVGKFGKGIFSLGPGLGSGCNRVLSTLILQRTEPSAPRQRSIPLSHRQVLLTEGNAFWISASELCEDYLPPLPLLNIYTSHAAKVKVGGPGGVRLELLRTAAGADRHT